MNKIEVKSIEHIKETLNKFDGFVIYNKLNDVVSGLDDDIKRKIRETFQEEMREQFKHITESISWCDALI